MRYETRITGILVCVILLSLISVQTIGAKEDTTLDIILITDEDINASFNASAGGDVTIWIDGIEIKSEFDTVMNIINSLNTNIEDVRNTANYAFLASSRNNYEILMLNESIERNNESIRDLVFWAFNLENDYFIFKNETHGNFTSVKLTDSMQDTEIQNLTEKLNMQDTEIQNLTEKLNTLQGELNSLQGTFGNIGTMLAVIGIIACGLFLFNRRYPFAELGDNDKTLKSNGKHHGRLDFLNRSQKSKKVKSNSLSYKMRHIRRNPEKSVVKMFF